MNRTLRFIGGPLHGELRALPDATYYISVPVWNRTEAVYGMHYDPYASPCFKEMTYERREVSLGSTAITVMAPRGMEKGALMRRLADLIENTAPPEAERR